MIKVVAFVGGIAKDSINRKLLGFFAERGKDAFEFDAPALDKLPYFSQDIENDPPAEVADFRRRVAEADALLVVTPEYNRAFPGVLKNALDWTSRPKSLGAGKPAAMIGASAGAIGTFGAQAHMRSVLAFLDWRLMMQPEFYFNMSRSLDEQGKLLPDSAAFIDQYLNAFSKWLGGGE